MSQPSGPVVVGKAQPPDPELIAEVGRGIAPGVPGRFADTDRLYGTWGDGEALRRTLLDTLATRQDRYAVDTQRILGRQVIRVVERRST